ncbi:hypothetical protein BC939DRAFT_476289 [Gamsiella multidivaricata]|uniref:uncharacterized protein n=1 Tax=Gamsiella multidivaricata TaxID=101098 RepID=UPI0022211C00|nr:uncharacterized protein BC939DRAFT_476289 [Gamsiella multidivaricata]KAI7825361.1 hypothetical protein BC939DRAFT_476289 [Gamsiella multidivaricata]
MQHQRASPPHYYAEPRSDHWRSSHRNNYYAETNMRYRSSNGYNGQSDQAGYVMHGSYSEHYDPGAMDHDRLDRNGNFHYEINNHGNGMVQDKHRNNSVSSNASSNSSCSTANKHPCMFPTCGWSFKRYEHLKRHMLVHTKERPFVCEFQGCDKSFSRSDNFSAHLRTHTKKTMHMPRLDRNMIMELNDYIPLEAGSEHGTGPSTGGMVGYHGGYSDYENMYNSSSLSRSVGIAHDGDASIYVNHGADRTPPRDPHQVADGDNGAGLEKAKTSPKLSSQGFLPGREQRSPLRMHPLDDPLASPKEKIAESLVSASESYSTTAPLRSNLGSVLPRLNPIKLDLKVVSSDSDDVPLYNQRRRNFERDYEHNYDHNGDHESRRHLTWDSHSLYTPGLRSPSPTSSPPSPRHHHHGHYKVVLGSSHDEPNLNPNGESPTQPTRAPSPNVETSSMGFVASHFVPLRDRSEHHGRDSMYGRADEMLRAKKLKVEADPYRPSYHAPYGALPHMSGSVSPPLVPSRGRSDGYLSAMNMDEDGNPFPGTRHRAPSSSASPFDFWI